MALFNIGGSGDWEVTPLGEELCQNFDKDNISERRRKRKNRKTKRLTEEKKKHNVTKKVKKSVSQLQLAAKLSTLINSNQVIKNKFKNKLLKYNNDDERLLNQSFSDTGEAKSEKRGIKRKREFTEDNQKRIKNVHSFKKVEHFNKKVADIIKKRMQNKTQTDKPVVQKLDTNMHKKVINPELLTKRKKQLDKLKHLIIEKQQKQPNKVEKTALTLRQKMMRKLKAARFRFLNEQIYTTTGKETEKIFRRDPEAFKAYHEGYKLQVKRWPLNPLDKIIKSLRKIDKKSIIADFGCGEAKLAESVEQKVHSFDLVAANERVTACDMAHVPLQDSSVHVVVFCLSLMGTNLKDYLLEANRVLKIGGVLKIAEVESRFEDVNTFVKNCEQFGFKKTWMDLSYNLFYFIDFKKESNIKNKKDLYSPKLLPCLYKKR